jgi:hypothetical protein
MHCLGRVRSGQVRLGFGTLGEIGLVKVSLGRVRLG